MPYLPELPRLSLSLWARSCCCSYAAIFKHAKDELGFCYYLIPCGAKEGQMGSCTVSACFFSVVVCRGW